MTNPRIKAILHQIMEDTRKEKLCLIEDIMKAKKLLFGLGDQSQIEAINNPSALFDKYYDMAAVDLDIINIVLERKINRLMTKTVGDIK